MFSAVLLLTSVMDICGSQCHSETVQTAVFTQIKEELPTVSHTLPAQVFTEDSNSQQFMLNLFTSVSLVWMGPFTGNILSFCVFYINFAHNVPIVYLEPFLHLKHHLILIRS